MAIHQVCASAVGSMRICLVHIDGVKRRPHRNRDRAKHSPMQMRKCSCRGAAATAPSRNTACTSNCYISAAVLMKCIVPRSRDSKLTLYPTLYLHSFASAPRPTLASISLVLLQLRILCLHWWSYTHAFWCRSYECLVSFIYFFLSFFRFFFFLFLPIFSASIFFTTRPLANSIGFESPLSICTTPDQRFAERTKPSLLLPRVASRAFLLSRLRGSAHSFSANGQRTPYLACGSDVLTAHCSLGMVCT